MKKIIFFFVLGLSLNSYSQKEKKSTKEIFIDKLLFIAHEVKIHDEKYSVSASNNDLELVTKYNRKLADIIINSYFSKLTKLDLKRVSNLTILKVLISKDNKLKAVSWSIFNTSPEPAYCNVLFSDGHAKKIISLSGTGENDIGIDIKFDTIIDISLKNRMYYLFLGSNKCGNLCIQKSAFLYTVLDSNIVACSKAFFDDSSQLADIKFSYILTGKMKHEPDFSTEGGDLIVPVLSDDKLKILGTKRYKIIGDTN